ncbi:ABC transporter ATP-binding protein [Desertimonas flava]|uniref:ABC transporter ATP-binding protein n=1 Tax=Desertimonas flava TaxID=2064846 RepID=UPI000E343047|nr:ABC transporter ATP-binding protein [Desertimonas flava]
MSVAVDHVVHVYPGRPPVVALDDVTVSVPTGRILAVLGQSGSGKTSLLRVIAGFERPQSGRVVLGDQPVSDGQRFVPANKRRVGIVPQEGALFPHLDVAGNVGFGLNHMDRRARRARVGELLDLVGLTGYEHRRPRELSGGQQQRVAVARALAPRPEVVLLDEPFSALDAALRSSIRDEIADLLRDAGATAVIVTHDRAEAMSMADEIAVISHGRLLQTGTPVDLYRRPVDRETAELLGDANVVSGMADGSSVTCPLGRLGLGQQGRGPVEVLVRPEMIVVAGRHPVVDACSSVGAVIVGVRVNGPDLHVQLELEDHSKVSARWSASDLQPVGSTVRISVLGDPWVLQDRAHQPSVVTAEPGPQESGSSASERSTQNWLPSGSASTTQPVPSPR